MTQAITTIGAKQDGPWVPPFDSQQRLTSEQLASLQIKGNGFSDRPDLRDSVFVVIPDRDGESSSVWRFRRDTVPTQIGVLQEFSHTDVMALRIRADGSSDRPDCSHTCFAHTATPGGYMITRFDFDFDYPNLPINERVAIPAEVLPYLRLTSDGRSEHPALTGDGYEVEGPTKDGIYWITRRPQEK